MTNTFNLNLSGFKLGVYNMYQSLNKESNNDFKEMMSLASQVLKNENLSDKRKVAFNLYLQSYPEVWFEFEKFSLFACRKAKKVGANLVRERLRWESEIVNGCDFKFNNNYTPIFTRMFLLKYPEYAEKFSLRDLKYDTLTSPQTSRVK